MKLYRVKDWQKHYETHETKKLVRLNWIPMPNKHDGLGFRSIAAERDGAALFGAWNLIVQVASKGERDQRGTLIRGGIPLSANSLAIMTGFPEKLFERSLEFFSQPHIGWIVAEDLQSNLPPSPGTPGDCPENPPDEGNGMEGKEGNGMTIGRAAGAAPAPQLNLEELKRNPAYSGINVEAEWGKCQAWCRANRKVPSLRRFVNWLNRCERPFQPQQPRAVKQILAAPHNWREILSTAFPDSKYAPGGVWHTDDWSQLSIETQKAIIAEAPNHETEEKK